MQRNKKYINTIFAWIDFKDIEYITRPEFINGTEERFHNLLKTSIKNRGIVDPLFLFNYSGRLKTIVGNNRMVVCKELNIRDIPCIITQFGNKKKLLDGKLLINDEQIRELFYLPNQVLIRRTKQGWVDQVNSKKFTIISHKYGVGLED